MMLGVTEVGVFPAPTPCPPGLEAPRYSCPSDGEKVPVTFVKVTIPTPVIVSLFLTYPKASLSCCVTPTPILKSYDAVSSCISNFTSVKDPLDIAVTARPVKFI